MQSASGSLDGIIDTVSAQHSITTELGLLKVDGKLILVGAPPEDHGLPAFAVIAKRYDPRSPARLYIYCIASCWALLVAMGTCLWLLMAACLL